MKELSRFFKLTQSQSQEFFDKQTSSLLPFLTNDKSKKSFVLCNKIKETYVIYSKFILDSKKLINRMTLELIDPLGQFTKSMINIYNENLTKLEKLILKVKRSRRNFEQVQQDYYKISHKYRQSENNNTKNDTIGATQKTDDAIALKLRLKAKANNYEQVYIYELSKYNTEMEEHNNEYLKFNKSLNQNEESRIFFMKTTMDKYQNIMSDIGKLQKEFSEYISKSFTNDMCSKDLSDCESYYKKRFTGTNRRFVHEKFVKFDEIYKKNSNDIEQQLNNFEIIEVNSEEGNNIMTLKEQEDYIKHFLRDMLDVEEIAYEKIASILNLIKNPKYPEFAKTFLDCLLEEYKSTKIKFTSFQNLRHLSQILTFITLSADSIFSKNFDLNFKIIYLAERLFYKNGALKTKTYLSAILSTTKLYRTKFFWKDFIELKLVNKLIDHISLFDQISVSEEKKTSIFSKIGNVLGIKPETKQKSILYNSRIRPLITNYDLVELNKIPILDQITTTELSEILKENIPVFANFNFPSEEALDMIADFSEQYKIPKEIITFYVTYFTVSANTIRKSLPNEMNKNTVRKTKYKIVRQVDELNKALSFTLPFLSNKDYLNLLLLNKNCHDKLYKKIYKHVLKNPKVDNKIRISIWKIILKYKELRAKHNYQELLKLAEGNERVEHDVRIDVERTFIGERENPTEFSTQLSNILKAIAVSNNSINYCQGMNYIAEALLDLTNDEQEAYYLFIGIFEYTEYPLIFAKDLLKLKIFFYVFNRIISLFEPEIYARFLSNNIEVRCFMPQWFITLFLNAKQYRRENKISIVSLRIVDSFLISGWKSLMKIGVSILHTYEEQLVKLTYEDMLQLLTQDLIKSDYFTDQNLAVLEKALVEVKIGKKLIKNIEDEYIQSEKIAKTKKS